MSVYTAIAIFAAIALVTVPGILRRLSTARNQRELQRQISLSTARMNALQITLGRELLPAIRNATTAFAALAQVLRKGVAR